MAVKGNSSITTDTLSFNLSCVSAASCALSIFGAIGIFLTFVLLPEIRNTARKLITCLTVADFIQPTGYLAAIAVQGFGEHVGNARFCRIQSAVTTYSSMVSFFLTVAIAGYLYVAVNRRKVSSTLVLVISNIVSWIIPGIIIAIAMQQQMLGRSESDQDSIGTGPWCWVKFDINHLWKSLSYMFLAGKSWELACYVLTAAFYVLLKFKLYLRHRFNTLNELNPVLRADDRNYLYVWLVLLAIRAWGTIRFIILIANKGEMSQNKFNTVLLYLQAIGDPSQAFCNFILFCLLDREVRQKLLQRCRTKDYSRIRTNDSRVRTIQEQSIYNAANYYQPYEDISQNKHDGMIKAKEITGFLSKSDTSFNGNRSNVDYGSIQQPKHSSLLIKSSAI